MINLIIIIYLVLNGLILFISLKLFSVKENVRLFFSVRIGLFKLNL